MAQSRLIKLSHGSKGRLNLIQKEKSVKDWLIKLIGQLRKSRSGPVLLKLTFSREPEREFQTPGGNAIPTFPLCGVVLLTTLLVWTRKEAEVAWKAGRTEVNLATMLPENVKSAKTVSGRFMVDGRPRRVVVCLNQEIKCQILMTIEKEKARETEKERVVKAKQEAMEEQWRKNGCFKDSSGNWVVPDELMWRSLPRGEDR